MSTALALAALGAVGALKKEIRAKKYTAVWDKVSAQCTREDDAKYITTTTTNFGHFGAVNSNYNNPFDDIYPWSEIKACNIDLDGYLALEEGADIKDCVTAWEGGAGFSLTGDDGAWVYIPEFWHKTWDDGTCRHFSVADAALPGYTHSPQRIRPRWRGVKEARMISGESKSVLLPKVGVPAVNESMSSLHGYAKNAGMTLENVWSLDAMLVLFIVEYANMNAQAAIGNGASDLYKQGAYTIQTDAAGSVIQVLASDAGNYFAPGAEINIGSSQGSATVRAVVVSSEVNATDSTILDVTLDRDVTVTAGMFWSIHGRANCEDDEIISSSGYIGTNGKADSYYRGCVLYANRHVYVLGAYRQTGTGKVWLAPDEETADTIDAIDTSICIDAGIALPQGDGGASTGGYIKQLAKINGFSAIPVCTEIGGSSTAPVGDYAYAPALTTGNTVLLVGGYAYNGTACGPFCGHWYYPASASNWYISALPLLKSP